MSSDPGSLCQRGQVLQVTVQTTEISSFIDAFFPQFPKPLVIGLADCASESVAAASNCWMDQRLSDIMNHALSGRDPFPDSGRGKSGRIDAGRNGIALVTVQRKLKLIRERWNREVIV